MRGMGRVRAERGLTTKKLSGQIIESSYIEPLGAADEWRRMSVVGLPGVHSVRLWGTGV